MKRTILILMAAAFFCLLTKAESPVFNIITLTVEIIGKGEGHTPLPKGPIQIPEINKCDHTLIFTSVHEAYTLTLLDEDGEIAYATYIPESAREVTLPLVLTDYHELFLDSGANYYYYSELTL